MPSFAPTQASAETPLQARAPEKSLQRLRWLVARLSRIELPEVPWRAASLARLLLLRYGLLRSPSVPSPQAEPASVTPWINQTPPCSAHDSILDLAERLHAGRLKILGREFCVALDRIDWNQDPVTGSEFGLDFGPLIDFRHLGEDIDVKYVWELNRHQDLVTLAQAWRLTGDTRHADLLLHALERWLNQCPNLRGVNWSSPMENGLRLVSWSLIWQCLGGFDSPAFRGVAGHRLRQQWLSSIWQHLHFVTSQYSLHSSANNHLVGEAVGVLVGTITWPWWPQIHPWRTQALAHLERQSRRQFRADGTHFEQAMGYHLFTLELLIVTGLCTRAAQFELSPAFWLSINRAARCFEALRDCTGRLPTFGDTDEARVLSLVPGATRDDYLAFLSGTVAILTQDPQLARCAKADSAAVEWVIDGAHARLAQLRGAPDNLPNRQNSRSSAKESESQSGDAMPTTAPWPYEFPDGGLILLGENLKESAELRLLVDVGPLGANRIAGHGHADALSFTLSMAGVELLIDPGTGSYNTDHAARRYFRSTSGHNTATIDDQDQAVWGGSFLWLSDVPTRLLQLTRSREREMLMAEHLGYERLNDPVRHQRCIEVDRTQQRITVLDRFFCRASHDVALHWHFHPECAVSLAPDLPFDCKIERLGQCLQIKLDPGSAKSCAGVAKLFRGAIDPMLGWYSQAYGQRIPSPTLVHRFTLTGAGECHTTLEWKTPAQRFH